MIAIVDYGMGNRRSVEKAFEKVGARALLTDDLDVIARAHGVVVPGVGAFPEAMRRLRAKQLDEAVRERAQAGTPVIGLCLGMQLLFSESSEHEGSEGLGLLPGRVVRLETTERLPHIGWNTVAWRRASPLTEGLPDPAAFYHVHTYVADCDDDLVLGEGEYGDARFVSFVEHDTVFGAQCHPEKSSADGLAVLRNFAGVCDRVSA